MPTTSFSARIKRDGNINRIKELANDNRSVDEIKDCFAGEKIYLVVRNNDIPLLENLNELERKALSAKAVKAYRSKHQDDGGFAYACS